MRPPRVDGLFDIASRCGCIVSRYDQAIEPGAEGKVEAELATTGLQGRIAKTIDLVSNDPDRPRLTLRLSAQVLSAFQVFPTDSPLIPLKGNGPTVKEFQIRTHGKEPVTISRVTSSASYGIATMEPVGSEQSTERTYKLTLAIQPEAPIGRSVFLVTAYTSAPREPRVNIRVVCEKGIFPVPASFYLGTITPATPLPVTQIVTLIKREGAFHIQKVSSEDPNLQIRPETVQEGSQYRLALTYRGGWPAGAVRSKVVVETDDPGQPRLEIPVTASVASGEAAKR